MAKKELFPLPIDDKVIEADKTLYQRKIGLILYVVISTRPDIAFAAATSANRETRQFARFVSQVSESLGFAGFRLEYHVKLVSLATRSIC